MDITPGAGISSRHPLFQEFLPDFEKMRDVYRGERVIKEKGTKYLPASSGMIEDGLGRPGSPGQNAYDAYRERASFSDVLREAVSAMLGVMHSKPPIIELPEALEPMREKATLRRESLLALLRRINEEQLVMGRLGLLLDLPENNPSDRPPLPYIAQYDAENVINWDEGRRDGIAVDNINLVVLDESEFERGRDFSWQQQRKFRVLTLGDPNRAVEEESGANTRVLNVAQGQGEYMVGVFREDTGKTFNTDLLAVPSIRGMTLDEIPFVFINSKDVVPEPEEPALLGLANLALTIYRGDADYRQALFMQGQDTLVLIGTTENETIRTGANSHINVQQGGDAKYIGVESAGLTEMREAQQNDKAAAAAKGGQLLDTVSRERESGEALTIRVAAKTATLNEVALSGAFGLERILKIAARWVGANPDEVMVTPNLDFVNDTMPAREVVEMMTAKSLGAPLSLKSIHKNFQDKGLTEMEFDDELAEIENEDPLIGSSVDDGPEDDPDEPDPNDDQ